MVFPYLPFILGFSIIEHIFSTYLDLRQHRNFKETRVPVRLQKYFTEEEFLGNQRYNLAKSTFGLVSGTFDFVLTLCVFWFGVFPWVWSLSETLIGYIGLNHENEIIQSLVFCFIFMYTQTLIGLPFSLYATFVIEEKFGFNKTTLKTFFMDHVKSTILSIVIGAPVIAALIHIIQWGGELFWFYVWVFVVVVILVITTIYPTVIAPWFNTFTELEQGELRTAIENLATRVDFPLKKLFKVDGSTRSGHSNAYFYGFFKNKRIVLYDTLLDHAENDDIVAIVAHELGHFKYGHTLKNMIIVVVHMLVFFYIFGLFLNSDDLYLSFGFYTKPTLIGLMLFSQLYGTIESVLGVLMHALSRRFEYQADEFATKLGYDLTSGLVVIHKKNSSNLNPDPLYSMYHFSHPTLVERLDAIAKTKSEIKAKSN